MSTLHVEFQEGWTGEAVDLIVDGEVRYHGSPRTRTQIGFAESVSIDANETEGLQLEFSDGSRIGVREPGPGGELWLGLSKEEDGTVRVVEQPSPFGYV